MPRQGRDVESTIEDLEFLDSTHVGANEAARRADFGSAHGMEKWLERHGRRDLWLNFKHRDPEGAHPSGTDRKKVAMTITNIDPIAALLDTAAKSTTARTRNRAEKVRGMIEDLRGTVAYEREEVKRKESARHEIERLERELAAAKLRLRGGGGTTSIDVGSSVPAAELRKWAKENGIDCPAMGKVPSAVREAYEANEDQDAEEVSA